jgi:hypothetical protein
MASFFICLIIFVLLTLLILLIVEESETHSSSTHHQEHSKEIYYIGADARQKIHDLSNNFQNEVYEILKRTGDNK